MVNLTDKRVLHKLLTKQLISIFAPKYILGIDKEKKWTGSLNETILQHNHNFHY